ncbi:glycoside hydrolase family 3 N-terminal domain-containing protein [Aquimarina agarivorans]|uniref:glycoside hydrolase family 3 N-terminal domain-containing protein n=1 Tax=Aquimarina agarivorans TaxID=980584 RepID=UPI000248E748|nr:glycoside hydrolase family 3 N-terminal domain-containing protein [Aquimarina agarivorans]
MQQLYVPRVHSIFKFIRNKVNYISSDYFTVFVYPFFYKNAIIFFLILGAYSIQAQDNRAIDLKIEALIAKMTLDQKVGQLSLRGTSSRTKLLPEALKKEVKQGKIGAFLNVMNRAYVDELQRIAVEESPLGIPLIFARDVIHGFKTIFPIPLGLAASWDAETAKAAARVSAIEASSYGIRWTFAPMLDITQDSRWGRIAESPGEDPYLASVLAKAYVEGFQDNDLSKSTSLAACAKHFIGYGAAIGGRDYNTAIIHEPLLRNTYLKPFEAAIDAGAATVMTSFNELNGVPASGNKWLLNEVLRKELGFHGFVVSDWNSITEMIAHSYAENEKHAAALGINAGLDMEMTSKSYENYIKQLLKEKKITETQLDFLVSNILRVKFRLNLFEKPYRLKKHTGNFYSQEHMDLAKNAAIRSSVLLKNNQGLLPLNKLTKVAVIGPLANAPHEQLGTWTFDGDQAYSVTPLQAFKNNKVNFNFAETLTYSRDQSTKAFDKALRTAQSSDVILFFGGEEAILSGEAHSRAHINLPGQQEALIKALAKTGKPIVFVIMAGRPITLTKVIDQVDAILMTWHPGTMGGEAIYEMLWGKNEPGGRLPITWPKTSGQLPLFYNHKNTGRPPSIKSFVQMDSIPVGAWQSSLGNTSHYLDVGFTPQFPFGYGLGYTTFKYSDVKISTTSITKNESLEVSVTLTNTGDRAGAELVQLYVQDVVGSLTRPVKELKGFKHIHLDKGASTIVKFTLNANDLMFVNNTLKPVLEKGEFNIFVGSSSQSCIKKSFVQK